MKQEIIADLSRITEEEQAILDGKTEVEKERYSSGQKFVMDAGKLLERGKLIDIRPHTRFIRFPAHSHNYVEMIYMCQGSTVHTINGDRIELKTGELLILNQNAVQEITIGQEKRIENLNLKPDFRSVFVCKLLTVHFHPSAAARSVPCRLSGLPFSVRLRRGHPRRNDRLPLARARGSP